MDIPLTVENKLLVKELFCYIFLEGVYVRGLVHAQKNCKLIF